MTSVYTPTPQTSFDDLYARLQTFPIPLLPPGKSHDPTLTDTIASLYLHPALEALLHIRNHDLPSAHFLVRHMQSTPADEGMYVHGILHRIEGDMDNARAWYTDCADAEPFENVWGRATDDEKREAEKLADELDKKLPPQEAPRRFLDDVEALLKKHQGDKHALEQESAREIDTLVKWCVSKFTTDKLKDATTAWVANSEEIKNISQGMTTGSEGHRNF